MIIKTNKRSFTLVEILVVVAIIGLLATIVMVSLSGIGEKGNNARRIQDLRSLHTALTSYYLNQAPRQFPVAVAPTLTETQSHLTETVLNNTYIQRIPTDPDPAGSATTSGYIYYAWNSYDAATNTGVACSVATRCKLFALCVILEPASSNKSFYCNKGGCKELTTQCAAAPSPVL